jgi:adenylylsulfate reductase subunit A
MGEVSGGRGPVYVDCRHLSEAEMTHLYTTLGYDKDTLPDFIEQKGVDLRKDRLEIMASEGMQGGPSEVCSSGIMIDEQTRSTLPGLFGAGDCADQMRCSHVCTTGGYLAGKMAAEHSREFQQEKVDVSQAQELKDRIYAPLRASGAVSQRKFEDTMRKMLWLNAGPARNEHSLNVALEKLEQLEKHYGEVAARNYHELMRVQESNQILQVAKLMCHASLARKETRFGFYHHRTDYPETNPDLDGQIVVEKTAGGVKTSFKKLDYVTMPPA